MLTVLMAVAALQTDPGQAASSPQNQTIPATLQGCAIENGRWVCSYVAPDMVIVPANPTVGPAVTRPATPLVTAPAPLATPAEVAPGAVLAMDDGALTEAQSRLVTRCAEAGWMSLCLPHERREARRLREAAAEYDALKTEVTRLLGQDDCDAAVDTALEAGRLSLAREARAFCGLASNAPEQTRVAGSEP